MFTSNPLLKWRKERYYTQQDVADLTGLSEQAIRRVEHGTIGAPIEVVHLVGGSFEFEYEKWRKQTRLEAAVEFQPLFDTESLMLLSEFSDPFSRFRVGVGFDSVNSWARAICVDPRRITEVEKRERPLGVQYRRALLQIGIPATILQTWERGLQDD